MPTERRASGAWDLTAVVAIPVGVGLVLAGQALEGSVAHTLVQLAAFVIVGGGTLGAVMLSYSTAELRDALRAVRRVFVDDMEPSPAVVARILGYATTARRSGVMALESLIEREPDAFLRSALDLAVEGTSQSEIRDAMEIEMDALAEREEVPAQVFEAAGGYAPTVGILGAVLGLIHVMQNLTDPSSLGPGIAMAFVATIYGVGAANLLLLPIGTKLRSRARAAARRRELLLDGVLALQEGLNPRLIERRLRSFEGARDQRKTPQLKPVRLKQGTR